MELNIVKITLKDGEMPMKRKIFSLIVLSLLIVMPAFAAQGNKENGKVIYEKRCWWCHGKEGAGDGPAATFLNPPPRDFTAGWYKFKTTPFDEITPADEDIFRILKGEMNHVSLWKGMSNTSMPEWSDMLSEQERWDLIAFIKEFAGFEKAGKPPIDYSSQVKSSAESIEKGKEIFKNMCAECHGEAGRGDATKKLKDDLGFRTWPRNLTKAWIFRVSNDPKDIFARVSVGIPGTQMPSFANPSSKKTLTDEERWHVANYVASIADDVKRPKDNTVLKALRVEGELPENIDDPKWNEALPTSLYLVPQIIAKERFFTPTFDTITARAFYNDKDIAILLEWDDRTQSIPGDTKAAELAEGEVFEDAVAIQFPVTIPEGAKKPYFGMGDSQLPVNIWSWKSERTDAPQTVKIMNATGFGKREERDLGKVGLTAKGTYDKGTWRVIMKRALNGGEKDKDIQFVNGQYTPIAFAAWDGSNGEKGSKHTMTTWYWLLLMPETGKSVYVIPIIVGLLVFGGELLVVRSSRKKK